MILQVLQGRQVIHLCITHHCAAPLWSVELALFSQAVYGTLADLMALVLPPMFSI